MANYDYDLGIIGGGAAGLTVASGAAQLGVKTLLVEKEAAIASTTAACRARPCSRPPMSITS